MKIELIKTTKINGDVYYSVTNNGEHVSGSVALTAEKAQEIYEKVVSSCREELNEKIEIIKSTEL